MNDEEDARADMNESIILFDGVCNFCSGAVNFVIDHDPTHQFKFASLQSVYGRTLLANRGLVNNPLDSVVLIENGQVFQKSEAALRIARQLRGWSWLYALRFIPLTFRDTVYDWVARNRYRFFGKSDSCRLPTPAEKSLFLG